MSVGITKRIQESLENGASRRMILEDMIQVEAGKAHGLIKEYDETRIIGNDNMSRDNFRILLYVGGNVVQELKAMFLIDHLPELTLTPIADPTEVVGNYIMRTNITRQDVDAVICNALEGGSTYWAQLDNTRPEWEHKPELTPTSEWATHLILSGGAIYIRGFDYKEEWSRVDLDAIKTGFELNAINRPWDANVLQGDASTADMILQYSAFGEAVFG